MIPHIYFCYVNYKNVKFIENQDRALNVLSCFVNQGKIRATSLSFLDEVIDLSKYGIENMPILTRNSKKEIKNTRNLPYIKEILKFAHDSSDDIFGYINSDILIGSSKFWESLYQIKDAYCFSRYEIAEISWQDFTKGKQKVIYGGDTHSGMDGVFFSKEWWVGNNDLFHDDLILGETEWDTVYRAVIRANANYLESKCLGHVYHSPQWNVSTPGAINNIAIWKDTKKRYGL